MKLLRIISLTLVSVFLLTAQPEVLFAQGKGEQDSVLKGRKQGDLIPYGQIARQAERQFGGRVVGQKVRQLGPDHWVYELRILRPNGVVINVVIDAKTGRVISTSGR